MRALKSLIMKSILFAVLSMSFGAIRLLAEPDFPTHGFKSSLPSATAWKLRQQFDEPKLDMVMRAYVDSESIRTITLLLGKNNTGVTALDAFTERWKKGFQKPGMTFTGDKAGALGGIPARWVTADAVLDTGMRHILALLAVHKDKVYTVIITSDRKPPEQDEVLSAFLPSVEITARE
jgi:hypothetical protein